MLTDTHYSILELLKDGQPLVTKRSQSRTTAKIGPERISVAIVADLEGANMIRCRQVDDGGALHGETRHFEFVKDAPDAGSDVAPPRIKRERRISRAEARQKIIDAWKGWWAVHDSMAKAATDADAHAFLRQLKEEQPLLFKFGGKPSPYEAAFSWLINSGLLAFEQPKPL